MDIRRRTDILTDTQLPARSVRSPRSRHIPDRYPSSPVVWTDLPWPRSSPQRTDRLFSAFAVAFVVCNVHQKDQEIPMKFAELRLAEPILRALAAENYIHPTPIQAQAIPPVMEGRDVLG